MNCKECLPLIPSYLDEELSEAQAAPLRQHLMDCRLCRKALSGEKAFKRWFEHEPKVDVAVPAGFAARVARRAFAGDTGSATGAGGAELVGAGGGTVQAETPLLQFVLYATAVAAGLLLVVSALVFRTGANVPEGPNIRAGQNIEKSDLLEELDGLRDPARSPEAAEQGEGTVLKDMVEESAETETEDEE